MRRPSKSLEAAVPELDRTDRAILRLLQRDSSITNARHVKVF